MRYSLDVFGLADSGFSIQCADMAVVERNIANLQMQVRVPFSVTIRKDTGVYPFIGVVMDTRDIAPA